MHCMHCKHDKAYLPAAVQSNTGLSIVVRHKSLLIYTYITPVYLQEQQLKSQQQVQRC